ncbi:sensor histidine kinase [Thermodesulfobacterium hveragerdense]|uniref:sensor histidine kinase n=1 Tax=Thermodesulfobacterium hveragerdense TaxID=53424 RepID=UPI00048E8DFC|nr:HAMP domain-containing sensor histidine kinase [Thermodesulfobacterium hveragerdense]
MAFVVAFSILFNIFLGLILFWLLKKLKETKQKAEEIRQKQVFWEETLYQLEIPVFIVEQTEEILWQNKISLSLLGDLRGKRFATVLEEIRTKNWEVKTYLSRQGKKVYVFIDNSEKEMFKKSYTLALSYLSHEIKTPFTILQGYAEKLEGEILSLNQYTQIHDYFVIFKNALDRIERLVSKLFTSLEYLVKELPLKKERFDLSLALEDVIFWIRPLCEDKNISLEVDLPERVWVEGDKDWLMQAFLNPLENAVKFTPKNGKIIIKAYARENQTINILIKDEGPGVNPKDLPFLGMPFFKSSADKGLGFGLFITKKVVEAHNGKVKFSLPLQGGLEVLIELPMS